MSDTVPDLRKFVPKKYEFEILETDGEAFIVMHAGDYLIYHPDTGANAKEVPIKSQETTSPGIILYTEIGKDIRDSVLDLQFTLYRQLTGEPLFWSAAVCLLIWLIMLIIYS
ncbi:MAG: hypothetical protein IKS32_02620 [Solobacterium sp.]|nr:hypothetical protein [Solobacterium sp.]